MKLYTVITCIQCYNMDGTICQEFIKPKDVKSQKLRSCARCGHCVTHDVRLFK